MTIWEIVEALFECYKFSLRMKEALDMDLVEAAEYSQGVIETHNAGHPHFNGLRAGWSCSCSPYIIREYIRHDSRSKKVFVIICHKYTYHVWQGTK
jgi:hypothetical protein